MAFKKMVNRHLGGYEYANCPDCNKSIPIAKPVEIDVPYCSDCGKCVLDAAHQYCGWCGVQFDQIVKE